MSTEPNGYPVGIVGESHYQPAIRKCRQGQSVSIVPEPTNQYDKRALRVVSAQGETIGYIPKSSFVQRLVHDEHRAVSARIHAINRVEKGLLGVVLDVEPM
jgi:hypothetical protein